MKFTCKECRRKFKVKNLDEIDCTSNTCLTKYNMESAELDFSDYALDEPIILSHFETEEPQVAGMTQAEWEKWADEHYSGGGVHPW